MTNKLVVIINILKVPKIKTILLYEMKFLLPNYSCLQNPWLGGYCPQIPVLSVLCPQFNLLNPPPNKIPGYATDHTHIWHIMFRSATVSLASLALLWFLYLDHKWQDIIFFFTYFEWQILMQTYKFLQEKCHLSDFNRTSIWSTDFCKSPQHNVSQKISSLAA